MILIITHKQDYTSDFVIDKLNHRNIDYYRFNCEDIDDSDYTLSLENGNVEFQLHGIKDVHAVWFRRTKLPDIDIDNQSEKLFILNDYDTLLQNMYHLIPTKKWLSFPSDVYLAENKLYQLKIANQIGFNIPKSVVTNSKDRLRKLSYQNGSLIIKPISNGRIKYGEEIKNIFTNKIEKQYFDNLGEFTLTPSIIQPYIEKDIELRITVVNKAVFSAQVDSQSNELTKVDWRKEKLKFKKYDLPVEVEEKCIRLLELLNISFGAIDLIKQPNGEYIFLEINPNGQWAWIEMDTGLNISDEIINFLTS
ncbi:MvdC/MvdD family ATP grasp protein [Flammeovirga aprica]|uniref:ATP-grasp domain-containing protein n=1 Tax=Flammeovirga aprica JL-4 TaxID=694437 RepID=A0A7X9S1W5_9BACT|nr:hypothetical protein [Flammeovirga aprica]NME72652.1 hypothetical protein [Flammeovirga aprica JL-4]